MSEIDNDSVSVELTQEMLWQSLMLDSNGMLWQYLALMDDDSFSNNSEANVPWEWIAPNILPPKQI